jgi:glycosyltransferase involved in cell wall biosynthesis
MLLTIIIPMYNVAPYLKECVNNIKISDVEYEILMINDGSPDNSLEIAERLSSDNSRISIFSQKNKGLGGARNLGIDNAKGKFILFLDADDLLILNDFKFLSVMNEDIIEFNSKNITENRAVISSFMVGNLEKSIDGINYFFKHPSMFSACNKIYNLNFINSNHLRFTEKIYIEDFEFNTRAFFLAKNVISVNKCIQHFVQVKNSITRNNDSVKKKKLIDDICIVGKKISDFSKNYSLTALETTYFKARYSYLTIDVINLSLRNKLGIKFLIKKLKFLHENEVFDLTTQIVNNKKKNIFRKLIRVPINVYMYFK